MRPRFEPDAEAAVSTRPPARLIDPEAYDASEQQFAASLEETPVRLQPRFVAERAEGIGPATIPTEVMPSTAETSTLAPVQAELIAEQHAADQEAVSWRQEVSVRVNNYRSRRRPAGPRYPSLRLKFEANQQTWNTNSSANQSPPLSARQALAVEQARSAPGAPEARTQPLTRAAPVQTSGAEATAKVLEFPRSTAMPPRPLEELAEPMLDGPRILEAPELVPPPPALGGILIEPEEEDPNEKRPGFEMPLQPAPMSRRLAATMIDALLVLLALAGFAYIFFRITAVVPPLQPAVGMAIILAGLGWAGYQYMLLVYAATTPGLRLAKLQLSRFDGSPVPRRIRRWRVLASVLSGVSLGLGYAWCFLDEDELCWHDRITHTYMAPRA
jgi:uncharacterized RDD family membrane protein YckC